MPELEKKTIEQNSQEWKKILYQIQVATGRPAIKLLTVANYSNRVERPSSDYSQLAIVDATGLKSSFVGLVVNKQIPLDDLILICGHINLEHYHDQLSKVFHFLICQVVPGSIAHFSEGFQYADSLLLDQKKTDPFHYNIFLKSYSQYQVQYECTFMIGESNDVKNSTIPCSYCGKNEASIYCRTEKKHFCQKCSKGVHTPPPIEVQKKMKEPPPVHQLEAINRTNSLPLCDIHGQRHQLYCLKCQKYICNDCNQQPLHSNNPDHTVRPIEYLYSQKRQSSSRNPMKTKQKLSKLKEMYKKKSEEVTRNYESIKQQLIMQHQNAMDQLQSMYKKRIIDIESDLINIEMELDRIKWVSSYIKLQEQQLKPIYFFQMQNRLEKDTQNPPMNRFSSSIDAKANLDQCSIIQVGEEEQINQFRQSNQPIKDYLSSQQGYKSVADGQHKKDEVKNLSDKLLAFIPQKQLPERGKLSLLLQNSGSHFFKFKSSERQKS